MTQNQRATLRQRIRLFFVKGHTFRYIISGHSKGRICDMTIKKMDGRVFITKIKFKK